MLRVLSAFRRKLIVALILVGSVSTVIVNAATVQSAIVGTAVSLFYIILIGLFLGDLFFRFEDERFIRSVFGIFLTVSILILVGIVVTVFYELDVLSLGIIVSGPLALLVLCSRLKVQNSEKNPDASAKKDGVPHISLVYILPLALMAYCEFLLIRARSGWVNEPVWATIPSSFFYAFFLATFALIAIIFYSNTRSTSKICLLMLYSVVSMTVYAVVLYPGNDGDPISHMGLARTIVDYGTLRNLPMIGGLSVWNIYWLLKEKALAVLVAVAAKMFAIDVYWVHTFITPMLWSIFIPATAYNIVRSVCKEEKTSLLAALLAVFFVPFVIWGSISTGNSLGFLFFFISMYFALRYLTDCGKMTTLILPALTTLVAGLAHPLTGVATFTLFFLAMRLKHYQKSTLKNSRRSQFLFFVSLCMCVFIMPVVLGLQNAVYLFFASPGIRAEFTKYIIGFNFEKLLKTSLWELIFGNYVTFSFEDIILLLGIPFLAFLGLLYAVKEKKKYDHVLATFLILAFLIHIVMYRILEFAMVNVPFGPRRVLDLSNFLVVPFAAVTIVSVIRFLEGGSSNYSKLTIFFKKLKIRLSTRRVLAGVLMLLSLSALAVSSLYRAYAAGGLRYTELELEAVRFIDENTSGRYVVVSSASMVSMSWGFLGSVNPEKYYPFVKGQDLTQNPSVTVIENYMKEYGADVGYFVVSSFRTPNFDRVNSDASLMFGLFKVLSNEKGTINIYSYKVPPLPPTGVEPSDVDVMAFYWDTPPGYYVQNFFFRIIFSPERGSLDVRDFWGQLYEFLSLNEISTDGRPLGNLLAIEYFDPSNNTWVIWDPGKEIPQIPELAQQFKFRLRCESESIVIAVEKGKPYIQLSWEGTQESELNLHVGSFSHLYIPGLIGEDGFNNVTWREYGMLYTLSRTSNVVLQPAHRLDVSTSSLTFGQIIKDCNLNITTGYLSYDFYLRNTADADQWAYVEVWLPDEIYMAISPPIAYSTDETTWTKVVVSREPIRTVGGTSSNWVLSVPADASTAPSRWTFSSAGAGGDYKLPTNFSDSGGGQKRLIFGLFLPAGDHALLRMSFSVYYARPLKLSYVFRDSTDVHCGLRNMNEGSVKLYNYGGSSYVAGLNSSVIPTSLAVTQDERGTISSLVISLPSDEVFSLIARKGVNTNIDGNENGVPDLVET